MWDAVYNKYVYMSSDFAVLLLCIPIVNIFWAFRFYRDFVRFYNEEVNLYSTESQLKPIGGLLYYVFLVSVVFCSAVIIITIFSWDIYTWFTFEFHVSHDTQEILRDIRSVLKHKAPMIVTAGIMLVFTMSLAVIWQTSNAVNNLADVVERKLRHDRSMGRPAGVMGERISDNRNPVRTADVVQKNVRDDSSTERPAGPAKGSRILIIPRGEKK
jgi:hypothetical protein